MLLLQVVRGDFIVFFNQIFDALCKLSADSDANVQSAAHLLDRLVKVKLKIFMSLDVVLLAIAFRQDKGLGEGQEIIYVYTCLRIRALRMYPISITIIV